MSVSKKTRFEVFERDSFTCQYCGRFAPDVVLEVDHILARAKGGTDDPENLITACFDCNRGKRAEGAINGLALRDLYKRQEAKGWQAIGQLELLDYHLGDEDPPPYTWEDFNR